MERLLNTFMYMMLFFKVLYIKHNFGINFAKGSEMLLSLQARAGVRINTSAHIENNLTIGGALIVGTTDILSAITDLQNNPSASSNVDLSNYYNKTESDTRYYTKSEMTEKVINYI